MDQTMDFFVLHESTLVEIGHACLANQKSPLHLLYDTKKFEPQKTYHWQTFYIGSKVFNINQLEHKWLLHDAQNIIEL